DETHLLSAQIGQFITIACRKNKTWYLAGINSTNEYKRIEINLNCISQSIKSLSIITDKENGKGFETKEFEVTDKNSFHISLNPYGGFVTQFVIDSSK
ncbi:MAG: glycoside hydrolase family 97 C-terminal domain-containing protein, partial [Bacteroidales bacterium]|nr:glycoside hydrolase family 97 C-terminal domain-containing protein [Bacteroidales bacterium]